MTHHYIIMGICGCGKTTVAEALQQHLHCPFAEGDDFHTQANRNKMGAGIPLNDDDRRPWLERLRDWMSEQAQHGARHTIVTCSALKRSYRDILRQAQGEVHFVHLSPPIETNRERMESRQGHYMKASMIQSQLDTLQPLAANEQGVVITSAGKPDEVMVDVMRYVNAQGRA